MKYLQAPFDCQADGTKLSKRVVPCYKATSKDDNSYKTFDGKSNIDYWWFDDGQILLPDGTLIMFENSINAKQLWVFVDLNGFNTPPNRLGYDLFTFEFLDGELRPMGDIQTKYNDKEKYCNPKSSEKLNGIACASEAKNNTDYFKQIVKAFK